MQKAVLGIVAAIGLGIVGHAQRTPVRTDSVQSFAVGGRSIAIPAPTSDLMELGNEKRHVMDAIVPPGLRLLAAFVVPQELSSGRFPLSHYGLVMVPSNSESVDFTAEDFKAVANLARSGFDALVKSSIGKAEDLLKDRHLNVKVDKPVPLGCLFEKDDAIGHGTVFSLAAGGRTVEMADGSAVLRVRNRVLFVHLYAEYKDAETVAFLRRTSEAWTDGILKANR